MSGPRSYQATRAQSDEASERQRAKETTAYAWGAVLGGAIARNGIPPPAGPSFALPPLPFILHPSSLVLRPRSLRRSLPAIGFQGGSGASDKQEVGVAAMLELGVPLGTTAIANAEWRGNGECRIGNSELAKKQAAPIPLFATLSSLFVIRCSLFILL